MPLPNTLQELAGIGSKASIIVVQDPEQHLCFSYIVSSSENIMPIMKQQLPAARAGLSSHSAAATAVVRCSWAAAAAALWNGTASGAQAALLCGCGDMHFDSCCAAQSCHQHR
jgi:hypothetical protein